MRRRRIFVRAYPETQTTANIRVWTKDPCDVIPQAERVAASVGRIYVVINYNVQEQFLSGIAVPTYQGEFAGYPIYNGWVVMTRDRRLPWIPQTLPRSARPGRADAAAPLRPAAGGRP